eukprot:TRINITY_DN27263_c0_g1_i3.p1 TRINITY_DN27263_c0_g1~~TRINITY_DN27263_c0_g1_i3.p1  ORF type:complete len:746 (+),score=131.12 TRINITY_DN27263_c0_g1_i3:124-2361(+)
MLVGPRPRVRQEFSVFFFPWIRISAILETNGMPRSSRSRLDGDISRIKHGISPATPASTFTVTTASTGEQIAQVIAHCERTNSKFTDPDFPADERSISRRPFKAPGWLKQAGVDWRRPKPGSSLFLDGVEPGDIVQGALGDCWFLSALSVVAALPDVINQLFVAARPDIGLYVCQFFKCGQWVQIMIDDQLPRVPRGYTVGKQHSGSLIFAHGQDDQELWVALVEKAYAKLHGCYMAMDGGGVEYGIRDLSSAAPGAIDCADLDEPSFVRTISGPSEEVRVVAGLALKDKRGLSQESELSNGLITGHAYSILGTAKVGGTRLVKIRNPWGKGEWNGDWSDKSGRWTSRIKRELEYAPGNDGCFWMSLKDCLREFDQVYWGEIYPYDWPRIRMASEWRANTAGGCVNHPTWNQNPQLVLQVETDTQAMIVLTQADPKLDPAANQKFHIGFNILRTEDGSPKRKCYQRDIVARSGPSVNKREVSTMANLKAGLYLMVPCTFDPGEETAFFVSVFSASPVQIFGGMPMVAAQAAPGMPVTNTPGITEIGRYVHQAPQPLPVVQAPPAAGANEPAPVAQVFKSDEMDTFPDPIGIPTNQAITLSELAPEENTSPQDESPFCTRCGGIGDDPRDNTQACPKCKGSGYKKGMQPAANTAAAVPLVDPYAPQMQCVDPYAMGGLPMQGYVQQPSYQQGYQQLPVQGYQQPDLYGQFAQQMQNDQFGAAASEGGPGFEEGAFYGTAQDAGGQA